MICEAEPQAVGLPFAAYAAKDEVKEDGTEKARKVFISLPTEVGQTEAEEVGAWHGKSGRCGACVLLMCISLGRCL